MHEICRFFVNFAFLIQVKLKTKVDLNVLCIFSYVAFFTIGANTLYITWLLLLIVSKLRYIKVSKYLIKFE